MACKAGSRAQLDSGRNGRRIAPEITARAVAEIEPTRFVFPRGREAAIETWPPRQPIEDDPAQFAMALIQGKWKIIILSRLGRGPLRLSQLRRMIPGASKKMLTQHLREMEEDGLVVRSDLSAKLRHVEYSLSAPLGFAALRLIDTLAEWGTQHTQLPTTKEPAVRLLKET